MTMGPEKIGSAHSYDRDEAIEVRASRPFRSARRILIITMTVAGLAILGLTRLDTYIARLPNSLLPLLTYYAALSSLKGFAAFVISLLFHITVLLLLFAWRSRRWRRWLTIGSIFSSTASAALVVYIASISGYRNTEAYTGSALALILLLPNLVTIAIGSKYRPRRRSR